MQALGLYRVKNDALPIRDILHLTKKAGFDFIAASNMAQLQDDASDGFMLTAKALQKAYSRMVPWRQLLLVGAFTQLAPEKIQASRKSGTSANKTLGHARIKRKLLARMPMMME